MNGIMKTILKTTAILSLASFASMASAASVNVNLALFAHGANVNASNTSSNGPWFSCYSPASVSITSSSGKRLSRGIQCNGDADQGGAHTYALFTNTGSFAAAKGENFTITQQPNNTATFIVKNLNSFATAKILGRSTCDVTRNKPVTVIFDGGKPITAKVCFKGHPTCPTSVALSCYNLKASSGAACYLSKYNGNMSPTSHMPC